uniref:Putative ovule protein n=1 Tax=Solanum chacoense TaxID=4108 RepID=A0A0V0IWE4_SOLCH
MIQGMLQVQQRGPRRLKRTRTGKKNLAATNKQMGTRQWVDINFKKDKGTEENQITQPQVSSNSKHDVGSETPTNNTGTQEKSTCEISSKEKVIQKKKTQGENKTDELGNREQTTSQNQLELTKQQNTHDEERIEAVDTTERVILDPDKEEIDASLAEIEMQNNNIRRENIEKETLEKNIKEVAKAGDISPRHTRAMEESHLKNKGGKSQKDTSQATRQLPKRQAASKHSH